MPRLLAVLIGVVLANMAFLDQNAKAWWILPILAVVSPIYQSSIEVFEDRIIGKTAFGLVRMTLEISKITSITWDTDMQFSSLRIYPGWNETEISLWGDSLLTIVASGGRKLEIRTSGRQELSKTFEVLLPGVRQEYK